MLDEMVSAYGNRFLIAAAGVSLALLGLFVVLWVLRHRAPSPFVRGGRNRQPRLQVLDAAAVDARRRLVLVRRDNIEHLIMIGGPTDIVIESGIGDERSYISVQPPEQEQLPEPERPAPLMAPVQQVTQVQRPAPAQPPSEVRSAGQQPEPVASPPRPVTPAPQIQQPTSVEPPVQRPAPSAPSPSPAATVSAPRPSPASPPVSAAPAPPVTAQTPSPVAEQKEPPKAEVSVDIPAAKPEPTVDDVFDAARKRVLSVDADEPARGTAQPAPQPRPAPPGGGAFEKLLEAEMATHLDSVKASVQAAPRPIPTVLPPSPPSVPPSMVAAPAARAPFAPASPAPTTVAPARPATVEAQPPAKPAAQPSREEPNLQTEIARIFGEMESGRDK